MCEACCVKTRWRGFVDHCVFTWTGEICIVSRQHSELFHISRVWTSYKFIQGKKFWLFETLYEVKMCGDLVLKSSFSIQKREIQVTILNRWFPVNKLLMTKQKS